MPNATSLPAAPSQDADPQFLYALIDERDAASFLNVSVRYLQKRRMDGRGPRFVVLSRRAVKYQRAELLNWTNERIRRSTADDGPQAEA